MYPHNLERLINWSNSDNMWMRHAAAVSLVIPAKKGMFLREVFMISDLLFCETEDLVRKGFGWLLKEASRIHQKEVYEYVLSNRHLMPRTTLRYAIKLMPEEMKKNAMMKVS
jgi:3-methyladenine DNA glycosylase AlkD